MPTRIAMSQMLMIRSYECRCRADLGQRSFLLCLLQTSGFPFTNIASLEVKQFYALRALRVAVST